MGLPFTVPWFTSGYCELLWLPQMVTFLTSVTGTLARSAIWPSALLWSRRVRQVMFSLGILGAFSFRTRALVFAGLATTSTCESSILFVMIHIDAATRGCQACDLSVRTHSIDDDHQQTCQWSMMSARAHDESNSINLCSSKLSSLHSGQV